MAASRHRQTSFLASPSVTALVTVANLIIVPVGIAVVLVVLTMSRRQDSDIQLLGLRPAGWQLLVPVDIGSHGSRFLFSRGQAVSVYDDVAGSNVKTCCADAYF